MNRQNENVWQTLQHAGVVVGEQPELDTLDSPWYIKSLLAISGWLASLFLLGFLGVGFEMLFRNATSSFIVGSMLIAGAFVLLKRPKNEFYEHVALAVSLAGQVLIAWTIFDNSNEESAWFLACVFQFILTLVMPNFIHRVFSSFFTAVCLEIALVFAGIPYLASSIIMFVAAYIWLHEFKYPKHMQALRAIGYGAILALIYMYVSVMFFYNHAFWYENRVVMNTWFPFWLGDAIAGTIVLYVAWSIIKRQGHTLFDPVTIAALLGTLVLTMLSLQAQGIMLGILILILGFSVSNRVLIGLGIASLLFYTSAYYYLLDSTLLEKSKTLLILGLALFATHWLILRFLPTDKVDANKEVHHG